MAILTPEQSIGAGRVLPVARFTGIISMTIATDTERPSMPKYICLVYADNTRVWVPNPESRFAPRYGHMTEVTYTTFVATDYIAINQVGDEAQVYVLESAKIL